MVSRTPPPNHAKIYDTGFKKSRIAFGEAKSFYHTPPNRSQMEGKARALRLEAAKPVTPTSDSEAGMMKGKNSPAQRDPKVFYTQHLTISPWGVTMWLTENRAQADLT
jgi:hypothetical protein